MKKNKTHKSLAEWRESRLHDFPLPSGLNVKLRDVTMTDLLFTGKLPPAFADLAEKASKTGAEIDLKDMLRNAADFRVMLDAMVEIALAEPQIGAEADDEHITLAELSNDDKMAVFNWCNREVAQLRSFREGEAEPVAAV
ncbi:MAG: hypothetical protein DYG85_06445 [Chloroflexi bacterium CFX1]|nr:conserved hypothetical protein [Virus Rctr41k]MCE7919144.1 hypothetical protein [Chloroflexi bacterium CFX1]